MVDGDKARGRAGTWPGERASPWRGGPWRLGLSEFLDAAARNFRDAIATDFGPGRLTPWIPVAFGCGVTGYFAADHEPAWLAALGLACACGVVAFLARRRPVAFPIVLTVCAAAVGFAAITLTTWRIAHPIVERGVFGVALTGFVEVREERERSDRIIVKVQSAEGAPLAEKPDRVRLSVRRGTAPPVGAFVSLKARLDPPSAPLRPGGYDLARALYFQKIGAVGFVTGAIKVEAPPTQLGFWLRYAAVIDGIRDAIDKHIRAAVAGDAGAIASALITGKRDTISTAVNDAMYVSSLAHVLSISGYHMAVVAGVVFFIFRAGLALVPGLAARHPIKKWGAAGALVAAASYLALSGAEVATQRAFIMTAVVLFGVMVDRAALTLRTLAIAAMAVLLVAPDAVVNPSFQMSFAATLALVATWERGLPWMTGSRDKPVSQRIALWGGREVVALLLASMVAGLATTPYVAFHFHRVAPYGVLANLLAMPIVSAWVMPAGLLGLVAMPFGFDAPLWRLMGAGIDWMVAVAGLVAGLPGAVGRTAAFGAGPLLLCTVGLLVLCLLRSRLRWAGAALVLIACAVAAVSPRPDVLVSASGETVAVRSHGRLTALRLGSDPFSVGDWLAADADARKANDASLKDGFVCDTHGCVASLDDGTRVALARTAQAVAEDCNRTSLVVTTRVAPPGCHATAIDRNYLRSRGALSISRVGESWAVQAARPPGIDRPWARARPAPDEPSPANARPAPRDATPAASDIDNSD